MRSSLPVVVLLSLLAGCSSSGHGASEPSSRPAAVASNPTVSPHRSGDSSTESRGDAARGASRGAAASEPGAASDREPMASTDRAATGARTIRLFYPDKSDLDRDCIARASVERRVGATRAVARQALDELVRGPTSLERDRGLSTPFERSVADPARGPLEPADVAIRLRGRIAVVSFRSAAAAYLNQAICARVSVTSAIEATLLQFPTIEQVRFAVEGDVIDEWDG